MGKKKLIKKYFLFIHPTFPPMNFDLDPLWPLQLYRQLNIYVSLVGVEVWALGDQISVTTSADQTMENFLRYRRERINPYHHNDNAQLITSVVDHTYKIFFGKT